MASKFHLQGGRAGVITADEDGNIAELSWEMLVGELDMVVYGESCRWARPERRAISAEDLQRLVGELATEMRIDVELDVGGSSTVFRGRR